MPTIEILPGQRALDVIEAVLLWPHDLAQRQRASSAALAQRLLLSLPGMVVDGKIIAEWADMQATVQFLIESPPPSEISAAAKHSFRHGTASVIVLLNALHDADCGKKEGLQAIKSVIAKRYNGRPEFPALSTATIDNTVWKHYRSVAHLWTSHYILRASQPDRSSGYPFPCTSTDIPLFLGMAEALLASGCRPRRQARPLLDASTAWRAPKELDVQALTFGWSDIGAPSFSNGA